MCTGRPMQEGGIYTTDADIQPPRNPTNTKQSVMTCPILKRPADCTRPGPSRLSFTPKPRPKQCVGELEIPGLPSTTRTLFSGLRVSTHGKQAGPLVGFYHSAGRQPANSTPRPAGGPWQLYLPLHYHLYQHGWGASKKLCQLFRIIWTTSQGD